MGVIERVRRLLGSGAESDPVSMFTCEDCSNVFTKTEDDIERGDGVQCPNCGSERVGLAASSG